MLGFFRFGTWATLQRVAHQIRTTDDSTAAQLVHRLTLFGESAYPTLIEAANSERSAVALAARDELDNLVEQWQQEAFLHPTSFDLDDNALPLAKSLEQKLPAMTASGRRWSRIKLIELLDMAQKQAFGQRWELIRVCDRALSSLPPEEPRANFEPDVEYRLTLDAPVEIEEIFVEQPRSIDLLPVPQEVSLNDPPPVPPTEAESPQVVKINEPAPLQLEEIPYPTSEDELTDWDSTVELQPIPRTPIEAAEEALVAQTDSDRTLFELLAKGDDAQQQSAARALSQRGYGSASPLDARMMISPSTTDRVALVSRVMTAPRLEPTKWLWRLAHDPAGEVRAAALSGIRTSGNAEMIEAAYELALRDADPRVATEAHQLRAMMR
ncbi:HEAT repeat domain-containing protein [Aeoliella mucimassa]|uniref:hypothetical protein n=1 Tax=Aeoliella mucimassa TaxID=2527972 RepID=UPI0011A85D25|nr:hypothetical protein [Aeoliella mucimassa]